MDNAGNTPRVILQEVGPRDGLQNERIVLDPTVRARIVNDLAEAGIPRIQIGSFVNPQRVPQMARTELVWRKLSRRPGTRYSVLILNKRGLEDALNAKMPHVEIYVSASETHSVKNSGTPVEKAMSEAVEIIVEALQRGIGVTAGVMCAFGCHYEGTVPVERVRDMVREFESHRPTEIGLADTTGMGDPQAMRTMIDSLAGIVPLERLALHLHDTRGLAMDNMIAALDMGVDKFDTSVGGLGGCPFVPNAAGNMATERVVDTLKAMGMATGIDSPAVARVRERLQALLQRPLGPRCTMPEK
ncbi:MAG: hydroxymethylglutaryl-CoA lyase [Desulfomonilaceae bacterium]|nr:hydroxymethylglutaryl-CoA lyase [Desulfomonilaceae bacterium]